MPDPDKIPDDVASSLIVKFKDKVPVPSDEYPYQDGLEKYLADRKKIAAWQSFTNQFPGCTFRIAYRPPMDAQRVQELMKRPKAAMTPRNLLHFFFMACPPGVDLAAVINALQQIAEIEMAYVAPIGSSPWGAAGPTGRNPDLPNQKYVEPSRWGIDAKFAWTVPGGDGTGQEMIELELGWTLNHVELAHLGIGAPLLGTIINAERFHGTGVLGIICMGDNDTLGVGITPNLKPGAVNVVSWDNILDNLLKAIAFAADHLSKGGTVKGFVLILEVQLKEGGVGPWFPCEVDPFVRQNIKLATALDVVVVEAAGNGSQNLDKYKNPEGKFIFKRKGRHKDDLDDSGAIMVGAARYDLNSAGVPRWSRQFGSNYGSRIDCFAAGEGIFTAGSANAGDLNGKENNFGSTSGATAIVAGAALATQGMYEAKTGGRFLPAELRELLSKPANGTPSRSTADKIGVMPDLKLIYAVL